MRTYTQYQVQSCGTTLEMTKSHKIADEVFRTAVGPHVMLLGQDSEGNLTKLQEKYNGFSGHSRKRQPGSESVSA